MSEELRARAAEVLADHCELPLPWMQGYIQVRQSDVLNAMLSFASSAAGQREGPIATGHDCPVCTAEYAIWPAQNVMVCHCQTYPWFASPSAPEERRDEVAKLREALQRLVGEDAIYLTGEEHDDEWAGGNMEARVADIKFARAALNTVFHGGEHG